MNNRYLILLVCSALLLTQCASLRQNESQSWNEAKKEWNGNSSEKQGVSDTPLREGQVTSSSSAGKKQQPSKKQEVKNAPAASQSAKNTKPASAPATAGGSKAATSPAASPSAAKSATPVAAQGSNELFAGMISEAMWEELFPNRLGRGTNAGKSDFYSFAAFREATKHFPNFLHEGDEATRRRELAAFLAHLTQETGGFRYTEQLTITRSYSVDNKEYPPVPGKDYHGRGPIQLSYNYNYGQFSRAYFGDKNVLLKNPELLVTDSVVAFGSAIWFWMTIQPPKPSCHDVIVGNWEPTDIDADAKRQPGFGLTLNIINASQCGKASEHADKRYDIYDKMCKYFGTTKGPNCDCIAQLPYGKKTW